MHVKQGNRAKAVDIYTAAKACRAQPVERIRVGLLSAKGALNSSTKNAALCTPTQTPRRRSYAQV